ncbi:putative ATPase with chaperone activity [Cupriavidus gilardii CR3]|uniref:YifB family Mg chelatase-like AAA ATPase n=2 Tax=Cupriavidus gilardii TaxID=82541 RepID=UPI0006B2E4AF|nr:YifB family Mg chelatase-like AAA ATPase [Cupriavidus gilardii]ALD89495.1 putative ATPase with chaperone activity [Cupriavidus gilardii CR3]KAB0593960.1 YifB family Mg chelatase-like AAA ATPase [Cupriavidus gilardii]WNG70129.1 YifB family Mg chelatase-like AAA ATPase [Cupriavidus gilardii]
MHLAVLRSRALTGIDAPPVSVEIHLANGLPAFAIVGLAETEVRESRERVRAAILNCGFEFPNRRITVNLAPADLPKESGRFDLAIALGILAASGQIPAPALDGYEFAAELSLSGMLRPVRGALAMAMGLAREQAAGAGAAAAAAAAAAAEAAAGAAAGARAGAAARAGTGTNASAGTAARAFVVAAGNGAEAALVESVTVLAAASLPEVCAHLARTGPPLARARPGATAPLAGSPAGMPDMRDVRGQGQARRAMEVAAAGQHSALLIGPPGTGKSMLAQRFPGLLPPMTLQEALESAAVLSLTGAGFHTERWGRRPFRSPHHTASAAAMVGGGGDPRPGEISLAHHGVLFLDELPEFERRVLEVLREPLESGRITISRAGRQADFPARFQFVAAMNPCPCGYQGHPARACRCTPDQVLRYQSRLSGPLLDRIDLQIEVPAQSQQDTLDGPPGEDSAAIRARVLAARARQLERQGKPNGELAGQEIERHCPLDEQAQGLLRAAMARLGWSARSYFRVLKVARTIADLGGADFIGTAHAAEAVQYRRVLRPV